MRTLSISIALFVYSLPKFLFPIGYLYEILMIFLFDKRLLEGRIEMNKFCRNVLTVNQKNPMIYLFLQYVFSFIVEKMQIQQLIRKPSSKLMIKPVEILI